ncbi:phage tail tape measure protein [Salinibacter altiplanensis]|uniref:phage tail tape measure protein n=1 Tax=Salinibacter altiplanensis TaxID=1803181 RepID=UPI000C9F9E4A|nr:phage tail tape measure protein [Salinibacter altiplanensis]
MAEDLQQSIKITPEGADKAFGALSRAATAYSDKVGAAASKTDNLLGTIKSAAKSGKTWLVGTLAVGVAAVSTAIATATAKAVGFENQLNEVRKTAGLTERQFQSLQEGLLDVQAELGTSQQELANIAAEAGRLGIESPKKIQEFTRTVALMSEATVASAGETAQGLAKISNAFDLPIERAEALGSVINELSNQTVADASQLIDAMTRVGAASGQVGLAADQVAGFAATLVDAGIDARRAGTGLRTIFTRMVNNSEKLAQQTALTRQEILKAFEEDGLPAIRQYLQALRELPKAQRAAAIEDIFGVEQSLKVETLVQNIDALRQQIGDAQTEFGEADSLAAEFAATTKDVANEWNRLTAKLSSWVTDFGDNFTGVLESALSSLNDMLGTVDELARDLADAQGQVSSVEGVESLVDDLKEARQEGKETADIIQEIAGEVPQAFIETGPSGEAIGVRTEALESFLEARREEAEGNLEERQTEAVGELNKAYRDLQAAQSDVEQLDPATNPKAWQDAQDAVQGANDRIDTLLGTLSSQLPEDAEKARKKLEEMISSVEAPDLTEGPLAEDVPDDVSVSVSGAPLSFVDQRLRELREAGETGGEGDGGASTPGGGEGPSPEERTRARQKLLKITRQITQEEQVQGAKNEEARKALKKIFDLKARIRKIDELQNALQGEQLKKAEEQKQTLEDRVDAQKEALEEAGRPDAPDAPLVEPDNIVALGEEVGQSLREGFPSFSELVMGEGQGFDQVMGDFNDRISELRLQLEREQISQQEFADRSAQAAEKYRQKILGIVQALEEMGLLTPEMAEKATDALEDTSEQAEETSESVENAGEAIQDTARLVRGIGDLASNFGDLSDEAETAIDSTATLLDNVGRLVELTDREGIGGLGDVFSGASSVGTTISGLTSVLGAAGGIASLIASGDSGPSMDDLRRSIEDNVRALEENTKALFESARVGEDISEEQLETAQGLLDQASAGDDPRQSLKQFAELLPKISADEITGLFDGLVDTLHSEIADLGDDTIERGFPVEEVVTGLITGEMSLEEIGNEFGEDVQALFEEQLDEGFEPLGDILSRLGEDLGEFSDNMKGVTEQFRLMQDLGGQGLPAAFEDLISNVLDMSEVQGNLREQLETLSDIDPTTEEGQEQINQVVEQVMQLMADRDLRLGGLSPDQVEELLETLTSATEGGGGAESPESTRRRQTQIQRTITEIQANELIALETEQLFTLRGILQALGGDVETTSFEPMGVGGPVALEVDDAIRQIRDSVVQAAQGPAGGDGSPGGGNVPGPDIPAPTLPSPDPGGPGDRRQPKRGVEINVEANEPAESIAQKMEEAVRIARLSQ